jgi:hypothetical protein
MISHIHPPQKKLQTQYNSLLGFMISHIHPKKKPWDPIWFSFRVYAFSHSATLSSKQSMVESRGVFATKRKWWVWLANEHKGPSRRALTILLFNVVGGSMVLGFSCHLLAFVVTSFGGFWVLGFLQDLESLRVLLVWRTKVRRWEKNY